MTKYYLIPWSVGFECRTVKPEGYSIEVIELAEYEKLKVELEKKNTDLWGQFVQMQNKYDLQHRHDRNLIESYKNKHKLDRLFKLIKETFTDHYISSFSHSKYDKIEVKVREVRDCSLNIPYHENMTIEDHIKLLIDIASKNPSDSRGEQ